LESAAGAVVKKAAGQAEDCPFQEESPRELAVLDLAMLGLGRLFIVDEAPDLLEDLLTE
jgi:hypothetical protein